MIWLRRIFAVLLALVFIMVFVPMLVVFRVNDTVGNPNFYIDQLKQANIYNFIYDDVLPAALNKAESGGGISTGGINLSWANPYIITVTKQALPPQWLQAQSEQVIKAVLPYVLGDTEDFSVNVPLKDRVETAAQSIKEVLNQEDVKARLYDQAIAAVVNQSASYLKGVPFSPSQDTLESMVRQVLPSEWLMQQVNNAIDEIVPYLTKDQEHFTLRLNISERMDALEAVVVDILKKQETYDYISKEVMVPMVKQNIAKVGQLPAGLALTDSEILSAVDQILPLEWYRVQVTSIGGQIFSYLKGTRQTLEVTIPLTDRKPVATEVLGKLISQKLGGQMNPGAEIERLLGAVLAPFVNRVIPDQLVFTEADLSRALGSKGVENSVGQARDMVQKGLTYTDKDLLTNLGGDSERIEQVRQYIASGLSFTEVDLRNWINSSASTGLNEQLQSFDKMRYIVGTARRWKMAAWLIPVLILTAIGMLGGRRWSSKLLWSAAVLAITGAIIYVISGPLFSTVAQPRLSEVLMQPVSQADKLGVLVTTKVLAIAQNAIDSFVGGIKIQAVILMVLALVLIAIGSIWHIQSRKRGML